MVVAVAVIIGAIMVVAVAVVEDEDAVAGTIVAVKNLRPFVTVCTAEP